MNRRTLIVALAFAAALTGAAAAATDGATDAAVCETYDGWVAFNAQWAKDTAGALTAGTLSAEVYDYITKRAEALAKALPVKPTPGDMVDYCEALNALYAR